MIFLLYFFRKEKKIFDPSDIEPATKQREEKSKRNPVSVKFLTPDNLKIKECSIALERLREKETKKVQTVTKARLQQTYSGILY